MTRWEENVTDVQDVDRLLDSAQAEKKALLQQLNIVIHSFSNQLPSPSSLFAYLRSANSPDDPRNDSVSGEPSRHTMNRTRSPQITAEILSTGEHVHKIRHVPLPGSNGGAVHKSPSPSALDGMREKSYAAKSKLRAVSTSLQLSSKPQSVLSTPSHKESDGIMNQESRPALPVLSHLTCEMLNELKDSVHSHSSRQSSVFNLVEYDNRNRNIRSTKPFVDRSLFFILSDPETLLKSFRNESNPEYKDSPLPHLDAYRLKDAFGDWNQRNGALIFDSLLITVEALFRPPPELDTQKSPRLKPSRKDAMSSQTSEGALSSDSVLPTPARYLSDEELAHIVMICIHALTSLVSTSWPSTWSQIRTFRGWGVVLPVAPPHADHTNGFAQLVSIVDELEFEPALRLADRLLRGIGTRMCFEHILANLGHRNGSSATLQPGSLATIICKHLAVVERVAIAKKAKLKANQTPAEDPGWTVTATFLEWLRTTIIKQFEGKAEINKWGSVGAAITLLDQFHKNLSNLNLREDMFSMPYLNERIDAVQEPLDFLNWKKLPNSVHLFEFPFLFREAYLVAYFRTINLNRMMDQGQQWGRTTYIGRRFGNILEDHHWGTLNHRLRVSMEEFLRLDISRVSPLKDTLDQLWGQEMRMLSKPLKVNIGMQEGEVGFDQGGVTYEFFRLVLGEAFKPDNGLFTVDSQTRMIWFHHTPFEPMWQYEMLGVLFSLAVYNGITLPVTFPLALYTYLLGSDHLHLDVDKLSTDFIRDGWPELAKSFDTLLAFEGDVEEVFARDYVFSYEEYGHTVNMTISRPQESSSDTTTKDVNNKAKHIYWKDSEKAGAHVGPVTNANRAQYVKDYIEWLTYTSVRVQLSSFRRGFRTCLHPKSLELFTPQSLRSLVEGNPTISVTQLRKFTRYEDGYSATHPTIVDFWAIVEKYAQDDLKRLLEFVTASERVPVTGYESMSFNIVWSGPDTHMLPTSSTCFGKLMLPEYAGRGKMEEKLGIAIQYSKGFGVV